MRSVIPGYYLPDDKQLESMWKDCVFIFDANVLLNLYSYEKAAKDDFIRLLREISGRSWIPYQVALEFQRNRLRLLAEKKGVFYKAYKAIDTSITTIKNKLEEIDIQKRHPSLGVEKFLSDTKELFEKFRSEMKELEDDQPGVRSVDEIRAAIDEIFDGRIGERPENQAFLDAMYAEGDFRYKNKIPPGYMDRSKETDNYVPEFYYGGLRYDRKYGDLILWKQLIKNASALKWKHIIFVTDDSKDDWWQKFDAQGEKVIGPRPELVEEIATEGGVDQFYMYGSPDFMRAANMFIGSKVEESTIVEADKVKDEYVRTFISYSSNHDVMNLFSKQWLNKAVYSNKSLKNWFAHNIDNDDYQQLGGVSMLKKYYDREISRLNLKSIVVLAKRQQTEGIVRIVEILGVHENGNVAMLENSFLDDIEFESESQIKQLSENIFSVPFQVITASNVIE
jgi:PIN like domain